MIWKNLHATFGKLEGASLVLGSGLNLIHAPNESGKSTWCAFLRVMLYGFPPRSRGLLADKNRYAPWSGSPMEGSLELEDGGASLTLARRTARANSPMGAFSAVYTGTATPVEGLTGTSCGETLLGVPREVFERSAFIRQSGIAIDQDAELERRIAALITTGEEDTSFSASYERLKKQLNARRYNKSGQLPQLEGEIARLEEQLRQAQAVQRQAAASAQALPALEEREAQLTRDLEQAQALQAQMEARRAQMEARSLYAQALAIPDLLAGVQRADDGVLAHGHLADFHHPAVGSGGIVSAHLAEGPFGLAHMGQYLGLHHQLGVGYGLHAHGEPGAQSRRLTQQIGGHGQLVHVNGRGGAGRGRCATRRRCWSSGRRW